MSKVTSLQIGQKKIGLVLRASSKDGDYTDLLNDQMITISHGTSRTFTIPHDGILYYRDSLRGDGGAVITTVNNIQLFYQNCTSSLKYFSNTFTYNVKKDDIIKIESTSGGTGYVILATLKVYHYEED